MSKFRDESPSGIITFDQVMSRISFEAISDEEYEKQIQEFKKETAKGFWYWAYERLTNEKDPIILNIRVLQSVLQWINENGEDLDVHCGGCHSDYFNFMCMYFSVSYDSDFGGLEQIERKYAKDLNWIEKIIFSKKLKI